MMSVALFFLLKLSEIYKTDKLDTFERVEWRWIQWKETCEERFGRNNTLQFAV